MTEIPVPLEAFGFLITLAVFVSGGLVYSLLGYWKAIRRSINGSVPFDLAKLKTGGVLGVMLGITATVYSVYNGDSYIVVTTVQGFITAVGGSIGIIYTVDKILLGSNTNIKLGVKNPFAKESKLSGDSMRRYDGDSDIVDKYGRIGKDRGVEKKCTISRISRKSKTI